MKLALITLHYPFGNGEPFIEDEIRIAEKYFDEILIFSLDKKTGSVVRYIPHNARIIVCRHKRFEVRQLIKTMFRMLSPEAFAEQRFAAKKLGYHNIKGNMKKLFITYYINCLLGRMFIRENLPKDDFMYYSYWMDATAFFLAKLKKKNPGLFCISRAHGGDCFIERGYQPFRREILTYLNEIHSISEAGKENMTTKLLPYVNDNHAEINVSRLGVLKDNDKMNPPANYNDVFHIVSCSNVIQLKRIDLLIDALSEINDINIHWLHFGDGILLEQITQYANDKLKNHKNIQFVFMGRVSKRDILSYYENTHVDLFVNCSDSEGIPVSIMEAFLYGIPAVARKIGGNAEIVSDNNGVLLSSDCASSELCNAISNFANMDPSERTHRSVCAYQTYLTKYNADINYNNFFTQLKRKLEVTNDTGELHKKC